MEPWPFHSSPITGSHTVETQRASVSRTAYPEDEGPHVPVRVQFHVCSRQPGAHGLLPSLALSPGTVCLVVPDERVLGFV